MGIKRKLSNDFINTSPASNSSTSSCFRTSSQSPSHVPYSSFIAHNTTSPWPTSQNQQLSHTLGHELNGRTRKRWRDLRPDAETVHGKRLVYFHTLSSVKSNELRTAKTLQKLYNAQQLHPHASPIPSTTASTYTPSHVQPAQKTSLHSFWSLPTARPMAPSTFVPFTSLAFDMAGHRQAEDRCEDCDSSLSTLDDGLDAMDLDIEQMGEHFKAACSNCGKRVCDLCAITRETRICLECATEGGV